MTRPLPKVPRLTKRELKENLWHAIECDYVEHETGPKKLAEKYQVSERSIHRHATDEKWKEKRTDFQALQKDRIKRQERDRSETYHERNQLMASSLQARAFRLWLQEQEDLQRPDRDPAKFVDTFTGLRERAAMLNSFAQIGQAVGYGPPEPPPPARVDYRVIINANQIMARKFDPETEGVDNFHDPIDVVQNEEGAFVPYIGIGDVGEE